MTIRTHLFKLAAVAAFGLLASSCVDPVAVEGYGTTDAYSNYSVTMGDGYAGRGYYYGPANTRYYERQPGVTYYSSRESVPQEYWTRSSTTYGSAAPSTYRREVRTTTTTNAPTAGYTVTLGDGYAGRGYYYGPPNTRYYDESPGVTYYRTRETVPSSYWPGSTTTTVIRQ